MTITLELNERQIEQLAAVVADRLGLRANDEVLTVKEAAKRAKLSTETIRRWIRAGRLPKIPGCRTLRIPTDELDRLLMTGIRDEY